MAFATVFFRDNFRREVDSDVISGADVEQVDGDVLVKFGDFTSNLSRDTYTTATLCDGGMTMTTNDTGVRRPSHKAKTSY